MPEKIPSEIRKIVLNEKSYAGTGTTVYPTFINYFFGNNGTGKSTLARAIKSGIEIEYSPGKTAADYYPLVFNQDFIDHNMHSYHNMPGVFIINELNAEILRQIDDQTVLQSEAGRLLTEAKSTKSKKAAEKEDLLKQFRKSCWDEQLCRDTFRMIFESMKQSQHYEMMMSIK